MDLGPQGSLFSIDRPVIRTDRVLPGARAAARATVCRGTRLHAAEADRAGPRSSAASSNGHRHGQRCAAPGAWTGDDRRDVAARCQPAATVVVADALVPGEEQQPARPQGVQQRRQQLRKELVSSGRRAIVHVVAQVWGDPDERGQPAVALIDGKLRERHDPAAPCRLGKDPRVGDERVSGQAAGSLLKAQQT